MNPDNGISFKDWLIQELAWLWQAVHNSYGKVKGQKYLEEKKWQYDENENPAILLFDYTLR